MIKLRLERIVRTPAAAYTKGKLFVDGQFQCYTLEDQVRVGDILDVKVYGETAIPAGTYKVVLQNSPKYGKDTLTLLDVSNFMHIRVHAGNKHQDTRGCLLVGEDLAEETPNFIGKSRVALTKLKERLVPWMKSGEKCQIEIVNNFVDEPAEKSTDAESVEGEEEMDKKVLLERAKAAAEAAAAAAVDKELAAAATVTIESGTKTSEFALNGIIIAALAGLAALFGYDVSPEMRIELMNSVALASGSIGAMYATVRTWRKNRG